MKPEPAQFFVINKNLKLKHENIKNKLVETSWVVFFESLFAVTEAFLSH